MTQEQKRLFYEDNPHDFDAWCAATHHTCYDDEVWRDPDGMCMEYTEVFAWYITDDAWWQHNKTMQLSLNLLKGGEQ